MNSNQSDKENPEEIDDFIINNTKERIDQELQNVAADELKANILAGTSIILLILSFTEYFQGITKHAMSNSDILLTLILSLIALALAFVCGIFIIFPRNRLQLWKPRESNDEYAAKNITEFSKTEKREFKEEIIKNFEVIESSRGKDGIFLRFGYATLSFGVIMSFITLYLHTFVEKSNG